jgi:hypothetical protein
MSKYKVAYVDESDPDIRKFQRFAYNYFEIIPFKPNRDKEVTAQEILESHVDAIVADFLLSEEDVTIHYNGADLLSLILDEREYFPVFILTSYEEDAVSKGDDVNIVYEKGEITQGEKFLERVKFQIEKYHHKLDEAEKRLLTLLEESKERQLDAFEEDEIVKLDALIEKALDKKSQMPDKARQKREITDLSELLKKVDMLTKKLGKE